jgi:aldose 1-epimerase
MYIIDEIAGGTKGFVDNIWTVESHEEESHITFVYNSYDGEQGSFFF